MSPCSVPGCPNARDGRHLCGTHAWRLRTLGDVMADVPIGGMPNARRDYGDPVALFWSHLDKTATCWLWTRKSRTNGYGLVGPTERINKMTGEKLVHRIAFTLTHGPIPDGVEIHHTCEVRDCANPDHLEAKPQGEHRSDHKTNTDTCRNGHPWTPENVRVYRNGRRYCRTCLNAQRRRSRSRKRAHDSGNRA